MDSVRSSVKDFHGSRAIPQELQSAPSVGSVAARAQDGYGLADAPPPFDESCVGLSLPSFDPREGSPSLSGSSTRTDPKEPELSSVAPYSGRSTQAPAYCGSRSDFCALSELSRTSDAIFFSNAPGSGPAFPPWSSSSKLFPQEQKWKYLYAGVFPFKEAVCYKWDLHAAPVLQKIFGIEGHPHWFVRHAFVDNSARADAFALCRELYNRASYYLSPAAMLWWALARAQAAHGPELESIGERPRRLHQVPQSAPIKMINSYARLAASSKGVDPFWEQVWSVANDLLGGQPSAAGRAAPRPRQGVLSLIGPCVWGPHEQKGPGTPDPGLSVSHFFRWERGWEIFYPTDQGLFVTSGKIACKSWETQAAPRLHTLFSITPSLSPTWVANGIDDKARAKSFHLCLRLYSKAAYFLSPSLYLWWAVARVTARTREELRVVGPHPRRLCAGAQNPPASMLEGYRSMVAHSSLRSAFWREIWTVALHLLEHGTLPGGVPSPSYPMLITSPSPSLTAWSTGPARAFGSKFSSDVAGDGPVLVPCNTPRRAAHSVLPVTHPVSWRTGPASLAGSAFSSDVEGDGPKRRAVPIARKVHGTRSDDRRAQAAVIIHRFWRQRSRPTRLWFVRWIGGVRYVPRPLRADRGGPSSSPSDGGVHPVMWIEGVRYVPRPLREDCGGSPSPPSDGGAPSSSPAELAEARLFNALSVRRAAARGAGPSSLPSAAPRWHECADYAGCGPGGLQCTSCQLSDPRGRDYPRSPAALTLTRWAHLCISRMRASGRMDSGPSRESSSCASSLPTRNLLAGPSPSLKRKQPGRQCKRPMSDQAAGKRARLSSCSDPRSDSAVAAGAPTPPPALQPPDVSDMVVLARRPIPLLGCSICSPGGERKYEEGSLSPPSSPEEDGSYTISVEVDLCHSPWDQASSSPRLSETLVQIRAHGKVGGLPINLQYACAVESLHPIWVLEEWGQLFSLAVILLTAPLVSFTVYTEILLCRAPGGDRFAAYSNWELFLFCRSLLRERAA